MPDSSRLLAAISAVQLACRATAAVQRAMRIDGPAAMMKADQSPVTIADFAAQVLVIRSLSAAFPGEPIVAEEDADGLRAEGREELRERVRSAVSDALGQQVSAGEVLDWLDRGRARGGTGIFWALDPVDGTRGFLRGGQYAVALALVEDGQPTVGVLGCPNYREENAPRPGLLFAARRGHGAFEIPLDAAAPTAPPGPRVPLPRARAGALRFCESAEAGHSDHERARAVAAALGIATPPLRIDSQAKYGALARGDASIYMRLPTRADYREKIWDHAAGALLVECAGGTVTDANGEALDYGQGVRFERNSGILASLGTDHGELVRAVRAAGAG
ncbi:MAG: 3'(2'),5'-bisphosphate nucleotidase [Planctomycetota bacterium]